MPTRPCVSTANGGNSCFQCPPATPSSKATGYIHQSISVSSSVTDARSAMCFRVRNAVWADPFAGSDQCVALSGPKSLQTFDHRMLPLNDMGPRPTPYSTWVLGWGRGCRSVRCADWRHAVHRRPDVSDVPRLSSLGGPAQQGSLLRFSQGCFFVHHEYAASRICSPLVQPLEPCGSLGGGLRSRVWGRTLVLASLTASRFIP
jgi:hypothetical protein